MTAEAGIRMGKLVLDVKRKFTMSTFSLRSKETDWENDKISPSQNASVALAPFNKGIV